MSNPHQQNRLCNLAVALLSVVVISCADHSVNEGLTTTVARRDFREELTITGSTFSENSRVILCAEGVDGKIADIVEDGTPVKTGDTLCVLDCPDMEKGLDYLRTLYTSVHAEWVKTEVTYNLEHAIMEAQALNNEAEAQLSALDSLQLEFSPAMQRRITELNLRRAAIERERYARNMRTQEIIHNIDIQRIQTYLQYIRRRINEQEQRIRDNVILSPRDGMALIANSQTDRRKLQQGDNVWDGCQLVTLPDFNSMQVLMEAPERDYKRMEVGNPVTIALAATPDSTVWGHIIRKLPVGKEQNGSKVKLFEVTASIDSAAILVMPQSTAMCTVCVRELKDTLVIPSVCVYDSDSLKVAYVRHPGGGYEERIVDVAASSINEVVISRGLSEGEEIALLKPSDRKIRKAVLRSNK